MNDLTNICLLEKLLHVICATAPSLIMILYASTFLFIIKVVLAYTLSFVGFCISLQQIISTSWIVLDFSTHGGMPLCFCSFMDP